MTTSKTKSLLSSLFISFIIFMMLSATSCYTPSPLYGTWVDNKSNQIVFKSDGTYSATISISSISNTYSGTYTVLQNALTFTKENGDSSVTEWDIRGDMLYLNWTDNYGTTMSLTLYKTSN